MPDGVEQRFVALVDQGEPVTGAVRVETGGVQRALVEQPEVRRPVRGVPRLSVTNL